MAARLLFVIFMSGCLHEIQARGQKSELSVNPGEADVIFVCLLPGSVKHDTTCNLYFGEERSPVRTLTARENRNSKKYPWICQFFLPVDDILKRLLLVQQKDASCDYSLENKLNSFSPRSDPRSLADYVKGVSNSAVTMRTAKSTVSKFSFSTPTASVNLKPVSHRPQNTDTLTTVSTTGLTVSHRLTSAHATSGHTTSGSDNHNPTIDMSSATRTTGNVTSGNNKTEITDMWRIVAAVAGGGITAGIIVLVLTCLTVKGGTETCSQKRKKAIFIGKSKCLSLSFIHCNDQHCAQISYLTFTF
ncbi:uncharacterized protein LOC142376589 [Odontesthes bonariensis]|uniref:uncharacterized protein LOC142376589 n=1 Tax=Odontesthes bonariensis TaxID=219752 RepID=UPI003F5856BA